MIEGEEVLESAQETGYRLCVAPSDGGDGGDGENWNKVFSAQWDPNCENRLYVCSQKGQLRAYDITTGEYRTYRVLFRKHTSDLTELLEDGRPIHYHWDKMLAIPERPDELVFLLGVSKNLMYTALPGTVPYPSEPFISGTTRSDFTGYIYGTPVMELWTHIARITSVSVSPTGQILASGDEQGNVKLLMLRLLDQLILTQKGAKDAKKNNNAAQLPTFSNFLPEYKITTRAHLHGPIFAMQWLQMPSLPPKGSDEDLFNVARRTRYYCLATGSVDCAVRLWGVTCSITKGLTMSPVMVLDTLSTQTLALHSYLCISKPTPAEELQRKQKLRALLSDKERSKHNIPVEIPDPSAIFLSGGTSTGSIYLWKLDTVHLFNTIASLDTSLSLGGGLTKFTPVRLIDDGSRLHSLLQSSDRPIVSVAISAARDASSTSTFSSSASGGRKICLVAVDSSSCIRSHRESDFAIEDETAENAADVSKVSVSNKRRGSAGATTVSGGSSATNTGVNDSSKATTTQYPVVLCGEAFYPATTVISATFQEISSSSSTSSLTLANTAETAQAIARGDRWSYDGKFGGRSRLLVGTSDGQLQIVETNQVFFPDRVVDAGEDIQSLLARLRNVNAANANVQGNGGNPEQKVGVRVDNQSRESPQLLSSSVKHSSSSSRVAWSAMGAAEYSGGSDSASYEGVGVYKDYSKATSSSSVFGGKTSNFGALATHGAVYSRSDSQDTGGFKSADAFVSSSGSEMAPVATRERQEPIPLKPPPAPRLSHTSQPLQQQEEFSSAAVFSGANKENNADSDMRDARDSSPTPLPPPPMKAASKHANISSAAPAIRSSSATVKVAAPSKSSSAVNVAAPAAPRSSVDTAPSSSSNRGADERPSNVASKPILKTSTAAAAVANPRRPKTATLSQEAAAATTRIVQPSVPMALVSNSYSSPEVNSSAALYKQLKALQQRVDSDDISVTTIDTSSSARLSAAALVNVPTDVPRYKEMLPILDANDVVAHLAGKAYVPKKQVDSSWLYRKLHLGPSAQDLAPVQTPDPTVTLIAGAGKSSGIIAKVDPATLLPHFSLKVPLDTLFSDAQLWGEEEKLQAELLLELV